MFLNGKVVVNWRTSLLETVTYRICEGEYVAMSNADNEAMYLSEMQKEMGIFGLGGVLLLWDNESLTKLAKNPVLHRRSKHIEIQYRDRVAKKQIRL